MKTKFIFPIVLLAIVSLFTTSCNDDDPEPENPEELITTLRLNFVEVGGGHTATLQFVDLDGDGGNAPVITTDPLQANTNYTVTLDVLNESENPPEDVTEEIMEEDEEHQFFFNPGASLNLTHTYEDEDPNGNPLGLINTMEAGNVSSGNLRVTLRHEPDKFGQGVSEGDISNAGGETDIEVNFPVEIE